MEIVKPPKLSSGDTVGIVSPASPIAAFCPNRLQRGVECLKNLGFQVTLGTYTSKQTGHTAGTIEDRLSDLHAMYRNPDVKVIVPTIGGYNSHQLLEQLNFDLIAQNPKILLGYSDITALQLGIFARTGMVTYMGPALLPQFGEFGGVFPYTWDSLQNVLMNPQPNGQPMRQSEQWTEENLQWDREDTRARVMQVSTGWKILKHGTAYGRIIAGNLSTLLLLAGTPYWPDMNGAILCVEDDETTDVAMVDRYLTQLRQMGVYHQVSALVVGRFLSATGFSAEDSLETVLTIATRGYAFPIIYDIDFGHTDPMMVLANGVMASLEADHSIALKYVESTVSK
ncbi:MAG: LD-carboxypeptidase [Sulfobacillus benefaciens]|uniref:LD-carboxypeptidase n=1 Tax=Sulfobacillus benefaciens TaxID=453960 RepID=A0A2T2XDT6_9FIRM|nr:MAG: LD-carboxypeptidase [Sulfobacillus benefaciens]